MPGQGDINWFIAVFPCTDVSALNPTAFADAARATILSRDKKTGSVFGHILDYLSQTGVAFCILENVLALAKTGKNGRAP